MISLRTAVIAAALAVPAFAVAAAGQDAPAPAYELQQPTHELARDCANRMTRAVSAPVEATVRCTANDRGRLGQCELVEPSADARRQNRVFVCLAEAHRLQADDLAALEGEVVEINLTIG